MARSAGRKNIPSTYTTYSFKERERYLMSCVGLSHNTERRGELLLSFYFKIKTQNESNKLRHKFYRGNFKEKTTNSNSLKRWIYKIAFFASTERMQQHPGFLPATIDKDAPTPWVSAYYNTLVFYLL